LSSNHFDDSVSGYEKAGVGGSNPSLATILCIEKGQEQRLDLLLALLL